MRFVRQDPADDVVIWRMDVTRDVVLLYAHHPGKAEVCILSIRNGGVYRHTGCSAVIGEICDEDGRINDIPEKTVANK